jgi:enterochelin esterase family protein
MRPLAFIFASLISSVCLSQDYSSFTATIKKLYETSTPEELNTLWERLVEEENIPLIVEDSVAFLYRGEARDVVWMGDFNGWGYNKKFDNIGKKIPNTDIWILKASFPKDARFDYKIFINGGNWILDPVNADHQWSGVGGGSPNSELRMPSWKPDPLTNSRIPEAKAGKIEQDLLLYSKFLNYQMMYTIYVPPGYKPTHSYPVIYVTDGYEYMHERLGNMVTILDNLIYLNKIHPIVAVFIDHREPVNRSNNRRMTELAMNEKYLSFLTEELIPTIEKTYSVSKSAKDRAILGNSMGGLSAAYFAFAKPESFGLAGIQSPSFWFKPEIYKICDNPENQPVKMFMTTGTTFDSKESALKMKGILDKNTCSYEYKEVNQGPSWGNFRDLIDDMLIYFFGK